MSIVQTGQAEKTTYSEQELVLSSLSSQPDIVVSIEPLYEIVSSLSHGIVKPEVVYLNFNAIKKPLSLQQQKILQGADIIIRIGRGFEPLLDEYLERQGQQIKNKTITLTKYIPLLEKENIRHKQQGIIFTDRQISSDLRFWMDPRLIKLLVSYITPQLVKMDPEHQEEYLDNEIILKAQLKKLENKIMLLFEQLSLEQKQMLVQFNPYLKNRYLSFGKIKQINKKRVTQSDSISSCINESSFETIPLNLEYTEKALLSLLHHMEGCSQSTLINQ